MFRGKSDRDKLSATTIDTFIRPPRSKSNIEEFKAKLKHIQEQAARNGPQTTHYFQKPSLKKPNVQIEYLDKKKVHTRLMKMTNRIEVGKYRMLIQVQKNPEDNLMVKEKKIQDEISQKDYKEIYDIFVNDKNTGALLKLSNQILTMYEIYDEADAEIHKKNSCFRITPNRKNKSLSYSRMKNPTEFSIDLNSQIDMNILKDEQLRKFYSKVYEKLAAKSTKLDKPRPPDPEDIIKNRFQKKFFCDRLKKKPIDIPRHQTLDHQSPKNDKIDTELVQMLKNLPKNTLRIIKEQNKILDNAENHGISVENKEKLLRKFDETIYGMERVHHVSQRKRKSKFPTIQQI